MTTFPQRVVAGLSAATIAGALTVAAPLGLPLVTRWEGVRLVPYRDVAGIWTVCSGETKVEMRRYTAADCRAMTERAWYEYGGAVLACVPQLAPYDRRYQLAAAVKLTINIGVVAWCDSTAASRFKAGRWRQGCEAFARFNKATIAGRKVVVPGLVNVRADEMRLCMRGLA